MTVDLDIDIESWLEHEFDKPCEASLKIGIALFGRIWKILWTGKPCRNKAEFLVIFSPGKNCTASVKRRFLCYKHMYDVRKSSLVSVCKTDRPRHVMHLTFIGRS